MTRTADRRSRQQQDAELHAILFELVGPTTSENLRDRLDDLEISDKLSPSQGLAIRACLEFLEDELEDAESLIDSAAECAHNTSEKTLVLHVKALLAVRRNCGSTALRSALEALWIDSDPRLWMFFLMIAHQTQRPDVVEATLNAVADADFFGDGELRHALSCDDNLDGIREYEAYRLAIVPRLVKRTNN